MKSSQTLFFCEAFPITKAHDPSRLSTSRSLSKTEVLTVLRKKSLMEDSPDIVLMMVLKLKSMAVVVKQNWKVVLLQNWL